MIELNFLIGKTHGHSTFSHGKGWKTPQPTVDDLEAKTLPKFLDLKPLKLGVLRRLQFQVSNHDSTMDDGEKKIDVQHDKRP